MGLYRFENGGLTALVNVGPANPREFREVASTGEKLRPLAQATGGTVRRLSTGDKDAAALPRMVELREANVYGGADWLGLKRAGPGGAHRRRGVAAGDRAFAAAGAARGDFVHVDAGGEKVKSGSASLKSGARALTIRL